MQSRQNLGVDFGSGQTPSTSRVDAANQQTQQQQSLSNVLALSDANINQGTLPLQLNKIGRLGLLTFSKNAKWGLSGIFGGDKSPQNPLAIPPADETFPAVSFPSQNHAQSSSTDSRSMSEPLSTREQQLPAQELREMKINKKEAERLRREKVQEERKLVERRQREQARAVLRKRQQLIQNEGAFGVSGFHVGMA